MCVCVCVCVCIHTNIYICRIYIYILFVCLFACFIFHDSSTTKWLHCNLGMRGGDLNFSKKLQWGFFLSYNEIWNRKPWSGSCLVTCLTGEHIFTCQQTGNFYVPYTSLLGKLRSYSNESVKLSIVPTDSFTFIYLFVFTFSTYILWVQLLYKALKIYRQMPLGLCQ